MKKKMIYCPDCGQRLTARELAGEGRIPYCQGCQDFRFPIFNTAISAILFDEACERILLIQQYQQPDYILLAGYVAQGESLETTLAREIQEELGLETIDAVFNASSYYDKSNSLMVNFAVRVRGEVSPNHEIDRWDWFGIKEAKKAIKSGSLAECFLLTYLDKAGR